MLVALRLRLNTHGGLLYDLVGSNLDTLYITAQRLRERGHQNQSLLLRLILSRMLVVMGR